MGITMTVTGHLGKPERPSSFFPKGALIHHLPTGQAVVSLPSVGPCALRGGLRSLRRAPDNAAEPAGVGHHCLCGETAFPFLHLRKPATGSFVAEMDDAIPHCPFSFACAKRNKSAPCGEQKGRDPLWRSIIWKLRS